MTASRRLKRHHLVAAAFLLATGGATLAQIEGGDRGVAPIDSSSDFEVSGINVDVAAPTAEAARLGGWRLAQRKAWAQLSARLGAGGAGLSDGALDQIVSAIVVEREQIGPKRYIARLGVLFDRGRTGGLLGISTYGARSAPMLVIPVIYQGGVGQVFETRTPWQEAWARYRTGNSLIDYVRPAGTGADPLLLNVGQIGRRSRSWWRTIIDQYGASDIVIPVVRLYRQWPGGPVVGVFQARYGPDNELLGGFSLRVGSEAGLARLMDAGVKRMDELYQSALRGGYLRADPSLQPPPTPEPVPTATPTAAADAPGESVVTESPAPTGAGLPVTLQFDTPSATAVANVESLVRGIPGVRSAATTSLALGGVSLLRVVYDGDPAALAAALQARGYQVSGSGQTLRVRRPQLPPPNLPADTRPAG